MSDEQHLPEHHHYDPLTDERRPRRRGNGFLVGVGIAFAIHAGIGYYLWKVKFEPKYQEYSDQAVKVKLLGFDDRGKTKLSMKVVDQETGEDLSKKETAEEPAE